MGTFMPKELLNTSVSFHKNCIDDLLFVGGGVGVLYGPLAVMCGGRWSSDRLDDSPPVFFLTFHFYGDTQQ